MVFDRLRGLFEQKPPSRVELQPDSVWLSAQAKLNGVRNELAKRSAEGSAMIALVAHFADVLQELEQIAAAHTGSGSVRAVLAQQLSADGATRFPLGESETIDLVIAERHPLASVDAELMRFAEALPCRCRMVHHLSLDDALLRFFGSDSIRTLLAQMGATEDEPITHTLITRSIQQAQQKIEAAAIGHIDANSAEEWLEVNVRV